jgi:hypothetical protein
VRRTFAVVLLEQATLTNVVVTGPFMQAPRGAEP